MSRHSVGTFFCYTIQMSEQHNSLFQVSVKGLFYNSDNKLLMIQEEDGGWEIPGGRIQKGEDLLECLKRECMEEMGLECKILEKQPTIVYSAVDQDGDARLMVFYKIHFDSLDFKPSDECEAINFYTKEEMKNLQMVPQIKPLVNYL